MACTHLNQLYQLCQEHGVRFSSSDLVRIVCSECGSEETCPSIFTGAPPTDDETDQSDAIAETKV